MLRKNKKLVKIFSIAFLVVIFCMLFYGINEPRSPIGHFMFYTGYLFPPTRPKFLQFYSYLLTKFEGGYIPVGIDYFLSYQFNSCGNTEWRGIIKFYLTQGSGRWGDAIAELNDDEKSMVINYLLSDIDVNDPSDCNKLVLIEFLRLDGKLHKGSFSGGVWTFDRNENKFIYHRDMAQIALDSFKFWWMEGEKWPSNKNTNPLEGTGLEIVGIP